MIGVKNIDKVRLLEVDQIPIFKEKNLEELNKIAGLQSDSTIGITFQYGIYIKKGFIKKRSLIVHELVHTMQYERVGGIENFLKQYLLECLTSGYPNGELEQEARKIEREICQ